MQKDLDVYLETYNRTRPHRVRGMHRQDALLRLAWSLGPADAFAAGVAPFLLGGLAKSIVAGVVVCAVPWRIRQPASTLTKSG